MVTTIGTVFFLSRPCKFDNCEPCSFRGVNPNIKVWKIKIATLTKTRLRQFLDVNCEYYHLPVNEG